MTFSLRSFENAVDLCRVSSMRPIFLPNEPVPSVMRTEDVGSQSELIAAGGWYAKAFEQQHRSMEAMAFVATEAASGSAR